MIVLTDDGTNAIEITTGDDGIELTGGNETTV